MARFLSAVALVLTAPFPALAQDMPLSQILIDGEGWKKGEKLTPKERKLLEAEQIVLGLLGVSAITSSPDESVVDSARADWAHISAHQAKGPEGSRFWGRNQYCPLRTARGKKAGDCSALCADQDGRLDAATPIGIQVFDPTGRLCGVMTAPAGTTEVMTIEGDELALWIGDTKYTRKLNAQGVK
jgi:hypothetical protein